MPYPKINQHDVADLICMHGGRLSQPESCPDIVFDVMTGCWMEVRSLFCHYAQLLFTKQKMVV